MKALALLILVFLPLPALASGFYMPWWAEVLLFLIATPGGWATLAIVTSALAYVIYKAVRK